MGARLAVPVVERARLIARLDARRPLIVLRAPRGYGKTTLAAQWQRTRAGPTTITAWLRPPIGSDLDAFWPALGDALTRAGLPVDRFAELSPREAVERALQADGAAVQLVLDDLDNVDDRRVDHELIELLRAAPRLHVLACVQGGGRLRAGWLGDLDTTTITAAELLFTPEETGELAAAVAAGLPPELASRVQDECGGWPAFTRAVLVDLAGRPAVDGAGRLNTTVDRIAGEFLRERLREEPGAAELLEFAQTTALAEELTESLAVALTDDSTAKLHFQWWVDSGVLLVDARPCPPVYRWPAAARRLFAAQLGAQSANRAARVHVQLVEAYVDEHPAWALTHALAAHEWLLVVRVIDSSWRSLLVEHRRRLYDAITATPPAAVRTSRRAMAMRDVMLQVPANAMLTRNALPPDPASIETLARSDSAPDELDVSLAVLIAFRNCASAEDAREVALRVLHFARATRLSHPAAVADLYPGVVAQVGAALLAAGDRSGAASAYREAYRRADEGAFDYLARDAASKLALVHALDGDVRRSVAWLQRYEDAPPASTWLTAYFEPAATTAALLNAVDRLAIRTAVDLSHRLAPGGFPDPFRGLYLYGRAQLALHDGRAADLLDELDDADADVDLTAARPHEAALLAAARVDLLLALGRGNQARAVLHGEHRDHPLLRLGQARLALLTGDHAAALRYAHDPQWERRAGARSRQEIKLLHAVAAYRAGDPELAARHLERATEAARATGALRPFTMVSRADLDAIAGALPSLRELLDAEPLAQQSAVFPDRVALVTLTRREQLVLEKLASGLTLQQTADALVVSYNTIRTQQASIYRKLGVDTRADAVAQAQQWSLL